MRYVITTVHGTWARKADWMACSALAQKIRTQLGPGTEITPLIWSGHNNHPARRKASLCLEEHLRKQVHDYPGAKLVLVCHSHGGNVALHALQDPELREAVAGVVCLATPFLIAAERKLDTGDFYYIGAPISVPLIVMSAWSAQLFDGWAELTALLALVLIMTMAAVFFSAQVSRLRRFAAEMVRQMALPSMDPARLLIIRSPGDEASSTLAAAQLLCFSTARVYLWGKTRIQRLEERLGRFSRWKSLATGVGALMLAVTFLSISAGAITTWPIPPGWPRFVLLSLGIAFWAVSAWAFWVWWDARLGVVLLQVVLSIVMWALVLLLSIALIVPFGPHLALANVFLDMTAEATPLGRWEVHQVPPRGPDGSSGDLPPMAHSVYTNDKAIALACDWIMALPDGLAPSPAAALRGP
jgi:hypothetical protein